MKYKIIELNETQLKDFNGKILQVVHTHRKNVYKGRDYLGIAIWENQIILTCLIEVEGE